jgi:hypothetical protein
MSNAGFVPPQEVRSNAKRGLELRQKYNRGGTEVGVARARDLSNGKALSLDTIKRMTSYFARHEVDKKGEGWGKDSAGYIAWLLWGGDAGWSWAKGIVREQESKEKSTMKDLTTAFFEIVKSDRNADGTMMVYGKATDDSLDIDQQICDPVWLDRAMPDWFKTGGNIREQHSNIAAGVAKEYEKKADGHYIHALVVDPISVKKVDTGVLKGFSIGIKSPRVVRDTKASNGRIIDGQIVEVSLVDRPANPNCQLVLAKSVNGEENLVAVEELTETSADIKKFDKATYDAARTALAQLISIEAKEMSEGSNEEMSLAHLLEAVHHLFAWYQGEQAEGEVMEDTVEESIEMAADKEANPTCDCDGCAACKAAGGCDKSPCGKCNMAKSAEAHKCLECGCGIPQDSHGRTDVSIAQMVSPAETPKSADVEPVQEELPAEEAAKEAVEETPAEKPEVSAEEISAENIEAIVEKAVKSATDSVRLEVALLLTAKEAAETKAATLEGELATAKSLAIGGGPKRTIKPSDASNDLLTKALTYKAKASATTDPILAKGYKALYEEFLAKSSTPDAN